MHLDHRFFQALVASMASLLICSCATAEEPAVRQQAQSATAAPDRPHSYIYPAGCYDAAGRPVQADPANPEWSADPACRPPQGAIVQGRRPSGSSDGPVLDQGSINLPPLLIPVPSGLGVLH